MKSSGIDFKFKCLQEVQQSLLIRLSFDKLLHILDIPLWRVGFIPCNIFSQIEKDDDLVKTIQVNKVGDTKPLKLACSSHIWNFKFTKGNQKEMQAMCKCHELKMIHG